MKTAITIINLFGQILALMVVLYVLLQMIFPQSKGHGALARIIEPLLNPIRKIVKPFKGFDFSPLILLVLILIVEMLVVAILGRFV